jgi:hypothetical protein
MTISSSFFMKHNRVACGGLSTSYWAAVGCHLRTSTHLTYTATSTTRLLEFAPLPLARIRPLSRQSLLTAHYGSFLQLWQPTSMRSFGCCLTSSACRIHFQRGCWRKKLKSWRRSCVSYSTGRLSSCYIWRIINAAYLLTYLSTASCRRVSSRLTVRRY